MKECVDNDDEREWDEAQEVLLVDEIVESGLEEKDA